MPDLSETIETAAATPAEVTTDEGNVKERPLDELIQADQYLQGKSAATKKHRGLRFTKLVPPGTV